MRFLAGITGFALVLAAFGAPPANAGTEQFSTFDVREQEWDDESLLDHMLTRAPRAWRSEWESASAAIRTSQGCLTSGQWFIDTDLKLRTPLGQRAEFGLDVRQNQTDQVSYDWVDFSFRFPTNIGTFGLMFRPLYDKSRQDFGFTYEAGTDTSEWQVQAAFIFEDTFNNLWAFRQTRVGDDSEPYVKHPYEPSLRLVHRGEQGPVRRVEFGGTWLTPALKRMNGLLPGAEIDHSLWGAFGYGLVEVQAFGMAFEATGRNLQAESGERPIGYAGGDGADFRRQWQAELAARRTFGGRVTSELRWLYQDRTQVLAEPKGPARFDAIDRLVVLDNTIALRGDLSLRVGGMFDRITVAQSGPPTFSYGTRNESRAYVGISARFGRVSIHAVEGIELDPEPYDVWLVHDKGFLHLQATF